MSEFTRITRECAPGQLQPELDTALKRVMELLPRTAVCDQRICTETISRRRNGDTQTDDEFVYSAALVTSEWLIYVVYGHACDVQSFAARLVDVHENTKPPSGCIVESGLFLYDPAPGLAEELQPFICLAPGPVADKFKVVLFDALARAGNPVENPNTHSRHDVQEQHAGRA